MNNNIHIEENKDCIICYNSYTNDTCIKFDCKHEICIYCYEILLNNKRKYKFACPLCRFNIVDNNIVDNNTNNIIDNNNNINNNYIDNIIHISMILLSIIIITLFNFN